MLWQGNAAGRGSDEEKFFRLLRDAIEFTERHDPRAELIVREADALLSRLRKRAGVSEQDDIYRFRQG